MQDKVKTVLFGRAKRNSEAYVELMRSEADNDAKKVAQGKKLSAVRIGKQYRVTENDLARFEQGSQSVEA